MTEPVLAAGFVGVALGALSQVLAEMLKRGLWGKKEQDEHPIHKQEYLTCAKHETLHELTTQTANDTKHIIVSIDRIEKKVDALFDEAFKRLRSLEKQVSRINGQIGIKVSDDTES
jgi:hypothetical protein